MHQLPTHTDRKPVVAIVGAGIAGLALGMLLERQGIEYDIFEQAKEMRPLGAAMSLGANVTPLMRQLGLFEEFIKIAKPYYSQDMYDNKGNLKAFGDISQMAKMAGGEIYTVTRPTFHALLMRQVPKERIHLGTKILEYTQDQDCVRIKNANGQTHEADILIGADGAHSGVRQELYRQLKSMKKLPASDDVPLPFRSVCLVGQTKVVDPERFPHVKLEGSQVAIIEDPGSPYMVCTLTTRQNTICWHVFQYLHKHTKESMDAVRNSEWGPEAAEAMCNEVRHLIVPGAPAGAKPLTMGDLIDETPKELISKVMLEEKVFDTWHGIRTALVGDACHKLNPAGGHGGINAIHDAIALANWISVLPSTKVDDIDYMFRQYKKERYPLAKAAATSSKMVAKFGKATFDARVMWFLMYNLPEWIKDIALAKVAATRPQVSFLPLVEDKGTVKKGRQLSLEKTLKLASKKAGTQPIAA